MKAEHLLFGAAYYDEYMPCDRIEEDMRLLKEAGMNVIRIAESTWSTWEPKDNVFDFSSLHRMLDAAQKYGIDVIVGTPTYAIPAWLAKKYPKILVYTKEGQAIYGHRQLNDITNPDYLRHAERIIRRLIKEVCNHPRVIGYQLDNETHFSGAACKETQALFVEKMKEKYPDIRQFNAEFGLDYWSNRVDCWEDFPDIRGTVNGSLSAAYKRFLRDCVTEFLHWQADIVGEYKRKDQFITHNFDYAWKGYSCGIQPDVNQFAAAKCLDVVGTDIYHPSQEKLTGQEISFGGAVSRALKKDNYLVLETQAQGQLSWLPYPGQLRLQAYSHLSSGANSVMYWHWHSIHNSFESYWKGILSHNLKPNAVYDELKAFGAEVHAIEKELLNLKKSCPIAIIADNASLTALDEFPTGQEELGTIDYNDILRAVFHACYRMNAECDVVSVDDDWTAYPILIAPALYSASDKTLEKLEAYVKGGGHLLLTFRSAFADEELKIYHDDLPHRLTECIGATYDRFTRPNNVSLALTAEFDENAAKKVFPASDWMELLQPNTAQVWARYVHPYWKEYAAVTHNSYGKGTATYLACFTDEACLQTILRRLCKKANVFLPEFSFPLIKKTGTNGEGHLVQYYFNYSQNELSFVYDGGDGKELISGKDITKGQSLTIPAWDLVIIRA